MRRVEKLDTSNARTANLSIFRYAITVSLSGYIHGSHEHVCIYASRLIDLHHMSRPNQNSQKEVDIKTPWLANYDTSHLTSSFCPQFLSNILVHLKEACLLTCRLAVFCLRHTKKQRTGPSRCLFARPSVRLHCFSKLRT